MFGATTPTIIVRPLIYDIFGNMLVYYLRENNFKLLQMQAVENGPKNWDS